MKTAKRESENRGKLKRRKAEIETLRDGNTETRFGKRNREFSETEKHKNAKRWEQRNRKQKIGKTRDGELRIQKNTKTRIDGSSETQIAKAGKQKTRF